MTNYINLKDIKTALAKNKWILLLVVSLSVLFMSIYLWVIATPIYQSSTQVLVSQTTNKNTIQAQDIQADLQLINTYSAIVTSPRILKLVKKELHDNYTIEELADAIKVTNAADSQILLIQVQFHHSKATADIANTTAKVFKQQVPKIMKVDNVTILSSAEYTQSKDPIKPHKSLMLILSFSLGLLLGIFIIFLRVLLDRTIKDTDEIQEKFGLTILGTISTFSKQESQKQLKKEKEDV